MSRFETFQGGPTTKVTLWNYDQKPRRSPWEGPNLEAWGTPSAVVLWLPQLVSDLDLWALVIVP